MLQEIAILQQLPTPTARPFTISSTLSRQSKFPMMTSVGRSKCSHVFFFTARFMQHQPDLVELGLARLKLFQAFTLPSMEYQKSRNFLWIIRTDPNLIPELKKALVETLSRSPLLDRIVLLGDNNNPGSFHHSPPLSKNPGQSLFGNPELYSDYLERAKSGSHVVVETRLDADDGLPLDFVTTIQAEVQERIQFKNDWIQWCSTHHQEWQVTHPHQADAQSSTLRRGALRRVGGVVRNAFQLGSPYGYVETLNVTKCITAGLTVAYGKNTTRGDLPGKMVHTHIQRLIPYCSPPLPAKRPKHKKFYRTHCLQPMYNDKPGAIRARSPTSTGMVHVAIPRQEEEENNNSNNDKKENKARLFPGGKDPLSLLWDGVENSYGMSRHQIRELRTYLVQHTSRIAADNLKGQCTKGHSCTAATKTILATLAGVNSTEVVGKTL